MRGLRHTALIVGLVCGAAIASSAPSVAATRALVVGVNEYRHLPRLEGAVSDARDIASALERIGAEPITVLLNSNATRDRIEQVWRQMMADAEPGDTLIFTYAGHGGQEPEKIPGNEADGKDETFLLGGFRGDPEAPQFRERIIDDEINAWFQEAGRRNLRVIFVADACHSGSMMRGPNPRAPQSVRAAPPYGYAEPVQIQGNPEVREADLPHVTFLSATLEGRKAPEIVVDGQKRGALSWAFARSLERGADRDRDGTITRAELEGYIIPAVRQQSEAQQTPSVEPGATRGDEPLLLNLPIGQPLADLSAVPMIRLRVVGLEAGVAAHVRIVGATISDTDDPADLIWDAEQEIVINSVGDIVAHDVGYSQLQAVVDKWRALSVLKEMALGRFLRMSLLPDDSRHPIGQNVRFRTEPVREPHITAFNLEPGGSVVPLYPIGLRDRPSITPGLPFSLELKVVSPVGADHFIVISSSEPLIELQRLLRSTPIAELPEVLSDQLAGLRYQIGIQGLYTTEERAR
jgi:uncharacterized caspase-like protein